MDARRSSNGPSVGETVSENEARQGVTGHNVRYVLGFGILGVVVLFALAYAYYF